MIDTDEKIENKKFYNIVLDVPKTQIILCHTGRDASNYYNSLKYRMDGDYTRIPHYMITKEGRVIELISPYSTSEFFGKEDVDAKSIFIILENLGWLTRKPELNNYINWIGDIYKGEVFRKKWRGHLFWANYTTEQLDSCVELIVQLNEELGVELEYTGHNVRIESIDKFKGVVSPNHVVETKGGIFWVNQYGAFLYDGSEELKELLLTDREDKKQKRISDSDWNDFISENSMVAYNDKSQEIFVIKSNNQTSTSDGDCYVYNLIVDAWTYGKKKFYCGTCRITNTKLIGNSRVTGFLYDNAYGVGPEDDGSPVE